MTESNFSSYKELHEAFMKDHNGTSILENFILISSGPLFVFFNCCLHHFLALSLVTNNKIKNSLIFLLDFSIIILPLVLNFTLFSNYSYEYFTIIFTLFLGIVCSFPLLYKSNLKHDYLSSNVNKPFITYFRSIVNIITAICILAVDFKVFPRRLAKAENFGYGLMDTGVGFYIVTNAIVTRHDSVKTEKITFLYKTFLNIVPLLLLGAARFFTVTAIDYQTHISEYGVHWNFFFTLAAVKLISNFLLLYFNKCLILFALLIPIVYQYSLSLGIQEWAMESIPRNNFFTANREGIISLLGYLSLYFASLVLGKTLKYVNTSKDRLKYLIIYICSLFILIGLLLFCESYFPNSRRFANITYVLWMLSMSVYIVIICFIIEISLNYFYSGIKTDSRMFTPTLLEAINYNGLTFFLTSNLLTGLVNICFQTMYISNTKSIIIITCYMLATCLISSILHCYQICIKWW